MSESRDELRARMDVELIKLMGEIEKNSAETALINKQARTHPWLPIVVALIGSSFIPALIGAAVSVAVLHK